MSQYQTENLTWNNVSNNFPWWWMMSIGTTIKYLALSLLFHKAFWVKSMTVTYIIFAFLNKILQYLDLFINSCYHSFKYILCIIYIASFWSHLQTNSHPHSNIIAWHPNHIMHKRTVRTNKHICVHILNIGSQTGVQDSMEDYGGFQSESL